MGRVQAATATKNAIQQWNPRYIILVGIAGGIASRNIHLGDILIADQIIDYEPQKITPNGVESRWDVYRTDVRLFNAYNNFQSEKWQNKLNYYRLKAIGLMGE